MTPRSVIVAPDEGSLTAAGRAGDEDVQQTVQTHEVSVRVIKGYRQQAAAGGRATRRAPTRETGRGDLPGTAGE
ncbi:hypothetical protein A3L22_26960 [Streptomyces griseus subsp. griseus]|nr:hypothetical protein A3L22_26960 [Streptomyces griseus subsp. griseus]